MNLTPERMALGRRNFLKALAGTPAMAALGIAAGARGPVPGGRVRVSSASVRRAGRSSETSTRTTARCVRSATSTRLN